MEKQTNNIKFERKRKFLMILPLLTLPFLTLIFWVLGGGKNPDYSYAPDKSSKGFNLKLPDPYLKEDQSLDKLSYYEKAASDSAKFKKLIKKDPYYETTSLNEDVDLSNTSANEFELNTSHIEGSRKSPQNHISHGVPKEAKEAKVYEKLEKLDQALREASNLPEPEKYGFKINSAVSTPPIDEAEFLRLEAMMQDMHQPEADDPELKRLDGMLEKILDIQHPDRVQEKLRQLSEQRKGEVYAVSVKESTKPVSLLDPGARPNATDIFDAAGSGQNNGFYSFDNISSIRQAPNAIEAVVHETQTLVDGATVKLRLINDVFINGVLVPKDNFLVGIAALNGERLRVRINSIRYENSLFPVNLAVYDMDGLDGIYIPGAITRDVAKQSTDRAVQSIGLTTLDPSIEAQAAGAGIEAAQSLLSKKIKLVKVTVKAGYQVLLFDEKQRH